MTESLVSMAKEIASKYTDRNVQALCLAEEAGELVKAYRRWSGQARSTGSYQDMRLEAGDLALVLFAFCELLGFGVEDAAREKMKIIRERGWALAQDP